MATTDYINILNAGSGLNTKEIIDSLIESEKTPLQNQISTEKSDIEVSISSYSTIKQNFSDLTTNLTQLDGITGLTISNNSSAFDLDITDSSLATEFDSSISISQLATGHTLVFDGFASELAPVGSGALTFEFGSWTNGNFTVNSNATGGTVSIATGADTLAEVKASINAAGLGVTASILKKSDSNYALVLKSQEGQDNAMRTSIGTSKTVSQTTLGVLNSTAEIQSIAGFSSSDLSALNGKTLFLNDGTNSLSVDFSSTPANLAAVVSAITSAQGYSDMDFTVASGTNALTLAYNSSDGDVNLAEVSILSTGGPDDTELYYLTNYETQGSKTYNPAKDLTVTQATQGVSNTTAEVQSVAGFSSADLSSLGGKTLFFHDGTNSLSVDVSSSPADLASLVTTITSATGYSNMDFTVSAGTDALTLTYNSSDGNVELSDVSILPSNSLAVTQTTKGVSNTTAEVQSVSGFTSSEISSLNGKTLFLHDGTNSLSVDFSSTPADLDAVVTAITSAEGYSDLNFSVSAGTNALTLTSSASAGDVNLADVGFLSASEKPKIGFCWRSKNISGQRKNQYTKLYQWESLLQNPNFSFVNLQYDLSHEEFLEKYGDFEKTFLDTGHLDQKDDLEGALSLISNLDFVISASATPSMISSAYGIPTIIYSSPHMYTYGRLSAFSKCSLFGNSVSYLTSDVSKDENLVTDISNYLSKYFN